MQIQSHRALIKTFQRLPVNLGTKSQLRGRLPPAASPPPCTAWLLQGDQRPRNTGALPSRAHVASNPRMPAFLGLETPALPGR